MTEHAPVILIEDDPDDLFLFQAAYRETGCAVPLKWFHDPDEALAYLKTTRDTPFMIIADIHMPGMDGMALRTLMRETKLQTLRAIPFFFLTTSAGAEQMQRGYELLVQGFFIKPASTGALVEIITSMIEYAWLTED